MTKTPQVLVVEIGCIPSPPHQLTQRNNYLSSLCSYLFSSLRQLLPKYQLAGRGCMRIEPIQTTVDSFFLLHSVYFAFPVNMLYFSCSREQLCLLCWTRSRMEPGLPAWEPTLQDSWTSFSRKRGFSFRLVIRKCNFALSSGTAKVSGIRIKSTCLNIVAKIKKSCSVCCHSINTMQQYTNIRSIFFVKFC